jgi:hypothetical protein
MLASVDETPAAEAHVFSGQLGVCSPQQKKMPPGVSSAESEASYGPFHGYSDNVQPCAAGSFERVQLTLVPEESRFDH